MAYELTQKVTLTNLLSDPSFENEGWVAKSNCTVSKDTTYSLDGSYSLKIVTGTGSESYIGTTTNPPMVKGHTYYVCIHKYQTTTAINHLQFYWPEAEPSMYSREGLVSIPNTDATANGWYKYSTVNTRSNWASGNYLFRIDLENLGYAATAWYDNAMLIDLTADFGSGNEPDVEWCDENIDFFIGTKTLLPHLPLYIKQSSQWKPIDKTYIKNNGNWVELNDTELPNHINSSLKAKPKYIWKKYDNYDSHVKALITFNDTSYKDVINNVSPTITGTPSIITGKFSNAAVFPTDGSHYMDIIIPNLTTILNTNQWTFDWWEYCLSFPNDGSVFILSAKDSYTMIAGYNSTYNGAGKYFYASSNGSSWDIANHIKAGSQLGNQWVHRAIVRNDTSIKLFENGTLINTVTSSSLIKTTNDNIRFSYVWSSGGLNGYLDEFRFSDIPRWSENFSVPTAPYESNFLSYTSDENISAYPIDGFADDGYYYKRL